ncbi:HK97 family phage prohead protease [Streptomyces alkaliterrae]|uniref:HK97 family phage prohead protease n=1 Tax=Streptomyces alkaliterrae TaxID=2213162 RepID=A0A5P0YJ26_9ACTN|nr:HK97 family phage prohead protease [Streptomyces alkaliterrae]MBB1251837.1 HK97 family phage prohead protease [Streptomyces alkaliterrae]MBB1259296.1 HK97 family phage prohead protease [Streptomyces alkaliterrae]MQS00326.1 HK97 family phage prohead protease [Streptomyces alkaliterrae]
MTTEHRSLALPAEIRSADAALTVRGYAYRFNELSQNLGGFRERIMPGAGADSLKVNDVLATFNHDVNNVLGRTSSGTLRTGEDADGGWYEIDLPDTTLGRDLAELLARGDVRGSSFTFRVRDGGQRVHDELDPETGLPIREITHMDVIELGPVLTPAYPTTDAALSRSIALTLGIPDVPTDSRESVADHPARILSRALLHKGGVQ